MDFTQLLPWAVFFGFACAAWAVLSYMSGRSSRADERLEELRNPLIRSKDNPDKKGQSVLQKAAPALSKALQPKSELEQSKLKVGLANAGFNSPYAIELYLAIKFASLVAGVILGSGYGLASWGVTQKGIAAAVVGAGLGFYLPEIVLFILKKSRQEKIFLSLPDALDLLVVCVEAGLGLDAGMRRVSEELTDTAPELCSEFALCNFQLQMGRPRREVLHDLGVRSGVDDLRALSAILIQADRFGSSIAQALRVQSDTMRVKRSQLAEERAQKTAVKLIFPLVLFIFPGIFVVLVGPAAISMINNLLKVH
ncbi:MAG TPA: type II secretion system F family protein [Planctomycetaceae bacterium]|nr:type II secretion system F family protein [Planctomycetaceae bacterium]